MCTFLWLLFLAALAFFFIRKKKQKGINSDNRSEPEALILNKESENDSELLSKKEELFSVSSANNSGNVTTFSISVNEKEILKRFEQGTLNKNDHKRPFEIGDITGFYGTNQYSPNKEYCVSFCEGQRDSGRWRNGNIALLKGQSLLYKHKSQRPNDCKVTNDGIVICCDWLNSEEGLTGKFIIFDVTGEVIFSKKTTANLGYCAISEDSTVAVFETYASETSDSDKLFIVDVGLKKITAKFDRPSAFNNIEIDATKQRLLLKNHKGFSFEIDYKGKQTNKEEYQAFILKNGSVFDKLVLYEDIVDLVKYKDESYLKLLTSALTNKEASEYFGKDKIFRKIGDYYEATGNTPETIANWQKAMEINSKVGVKRKLDALKKTHNS